MHATYIVNMLPSKVTFHKSAYELLHDKQPKYENLSCFGCLCYATTLVKENKFSSRTHNVYIWATPKLKRDIYYFLLIHMMSLLVKMWCFMKISCHSRGQINLIFTYLMKITSSFFTHPLLLVAPTIDKIH